MSNYPPQPSSQSGNRWIPAQRAFTPQEAHAIAAEFRRVSESVQLCFQSYAQMMTLLPNHWTGQAALEYIDLYQPLVNQISDLAIDLARKANEIESIKINEYYWQQI
jgi:uncharacterized protein YukE